MGALVALLGGCAAPPTASRAAKVLPLPGEAFALAGRDAFLLLPKGCAPEAPMPWVLYAPTLPGLPSAAERWLFERLLASGVAIAGIDVGESYGNADACALFDELHRHLTTVRGLAPRPVLLGRSRGGLMTLAWAVDRPDRVAAFAGIYPVCDLRSYPGLAKAAPAYGVDEAGLAAELARHNPIERLAALAAAHVPCFAVHGDRDSVVPFEANSGALAERVRADGGSVEIEMLPGRGHDMDPGFFRSERLLAFVLRYAR